jgi:hypothetical protein
MASVQYQLFCRCINTVTKKAITNKEKRTWVSAFDLDKYPNIDNEELYVKEVIKFNEKGTPEEDLNMQNEIIKGSKLDNVKYDMLFVYSGCDIKHSVTEGEMPYVLTDKFERIFMAPWFIHSVHSSLNSVMEKAQNLVDKIGCKNIMIGKVVPLDQYIDIV